MTILEQLAHYVHTVNYAGIPSDVKNRCKILILDTLGSIAAGGFCPSSLAALEVARNLGGARESTILVHGSRTGLLGAGYGNGAMAHAFELDDSDELSGCHPGCGIVPAALAMAEKQRCTGEEFITAVVLGYDVALKIGRAASPSLFRRGFSPTTTFGVLGAAASSAKLLGLDAHKIANAIGFAATNTGGLLEYQWHPSRGGDCVRVEGGQVALNGLISTLIAQKGLEATETIIEGDAGFCKAFTDRFEIRKATDALGQQFAMMQVGIKRYACCSLMFTPLEALNRILAQHAISPDQVKDIFVDTSMIALKTVAKYKPEDLMSAQFSMPFSLALRFTKGGNFLTEYTEENLNSQDVLEFAKRVRLRTKEKTLFDPRYANKRQLVRVTVILRNGTRYSETCQYYRGSPRNPMTRKELDIKSRTMLTSVLPPEQTENAMKAVQNLEQINDVSEVIPLFVRQQ